MVKYVWFFLRCVVECVYIVMNEKRAHMNVSRSVHFKSINLNIFHPILAKYERQSTAVKVET